MIYETARETPGDVEQVVGFPQQKGADIEGHPATVEFLDNPTSSGGFRIQLP